MKSLIIVCGMPRSRTTFLFDCLLKHSNIQGASSGEWHTNENPLIMFDAVSCKDYTGLETLVKHFCVDDSDALAIKAPGYVFAVDYFRSNPFDLVPLFVVSDRPMIELIISNVEYPDSVSHVGRPLQKTDCPVNQQERFAALWPTADIWGRCYMRILWHLEAIRGLDALLVSPADYRRPTALAKRLCSAFNLSYDAQVASSMKEFMIRSYDQEQINRAMAAIERISNALAGK
jgi:hypothetical protein